MALLDIYSFPNFLCWWLYALWDKMPHCLTSPPLLMTPTITFLIWPLVLLALLFFFLSQSPWLGRIPFWVVICYLILLIETSLFLLSLPPAAPLFPWAPGPVWRSCLLVSWLLVRCPPTIQHSLDPRNYSLQIHPKIRGSVHTDITMFNRNYTRHRPLAHF